MNDQIHVPLHEHWERKLAGMYRNTPHMSGDDRNRLLEWQRDMVEEMAREIVKLHEELHLLEEVCAFYANDEDRFLKEEGEPYCIPTEVGFKARDARKRFRAREEVAARAGSLAAPAQPE